MNKWQEYSQSKVIAPEKLEERVAFFRLHKKRIATLNGSFDLLHAGHIYMLYEAAQVADLLIIAVNSDLSVKKYKGDDRPIVSLEYRMEILTAIRFVDYVTWFDEEDPCAVLEKIKPDVHVNGIEYGENCIEAETVKKQGGKLYLVDRVPGLATSDIIKKIEEMKSSCV